MMSALLVTLRKIPEQCTFFRLVTVNVQAENAESSIIQSTPYNF